MNTRLVPPTITPGNWRTVTREMGGDSTIPFGVEAPCLQAAAVEPVCDMVAFPPTDADQMERYRVNAKFIAAAPAMAEALASLISTYGMPDSGTFGPEEPLWEAARASLLAAGYQFAPNDPVC